MAVSLTLSVNNVLSSKILLTHNPFAEHNSLVQTENMGFSEVKRYALHAVQNVER